MIEITIQPAFTRRASRRLLDAHFSFNNRRYKRAARHSLQLVFYSLEKSVDGSATFRFDFVRERFYRRVFLGRELSKRFAVFPTEDFGRLMRDMRRWSKPRKGSTK